MIRIRSDVIGFMTDFAHIGCRRACAVLVALVTLAGALALALAPRPATAEVLSGVNGTVVWTYDTDTQALSFAPQSGDEGTFGATVSWWSSGVPRESVRTIATSGTLHVPASISASLFEGMSDLVSADLSGFDMSEVTSMHGFFNRCTSLTTITGTGSWDLSKVTNMHEAFCQTKSLKTLDCVRGWDTSHVTDLSSTFQGCTSLSDISALSTWDTSSVTTTLRLFDGDSRISSVSALSGWDMSKNQSLYQTFARVSGEGVDFSALSGWDTSSNKSLVQTFYNCKGIRNLDFARGWDVSHVTSFEGTFSDCSNLADVSGASSWDVSSAVYMGTTFYNCTKLVDATGLGALRMARNGATQYMFYRPK